MTVPVESVELRSSGYVYFVSGDVDHLVLYTRDGQVLDRDAAEVLVALGGEEPRWLRLLEALGGALSVPGTTLAMLPAVAEAVGRRPPVRAEIARSTNDAAVLRGLAAAGQVHVVQNPSLTPADWDVLVGWDAGPIERRAFDLADTLPSALGDHPDGRVVERVARNPLCPPEQLHRLAAHRHASIKQAVASNPHTSASTLEALAGSMDFNVRRCVAAHPSTPLPVLVEFGRSNSPSVRAATAGNPSLPVRRAARLLLDKDGEVHTALAKRRDLGRWLPWVERYARRGSEGSYHTTRYHLAQNPKADRRLQRRLQRIAASRDRYPAPPVVPMLWRLALSFCSMATLGITALLLALAAASVDSLAVAGLCGVLGLACIGLLALGLRRRARFGRILLLIPPTQGSAALLAGLVVADVVFAIAGSFAVALALAICLVPIGMVACQLPRPAHARRSGPVAKPGAAADPKKPMSAWWSFFAVWMLMGMARVLLPDGDEPATPSQRDLLAIVAGQPELPAQDLVRGDCLVRDATGLFQYETACTGSHNREVFGIALFHATGEAQADSARQAAECELQRRAYTLEPASTFRTVVVPNPSIGPAVVWMTCELEPVTQRVVRRSARRS